MGKNNTYKISTLFTANNRNFIDALEKNKKTLQKFGDDTKATAKKLDTLWTATHKASRKFNDMKTSIKDIAMGSLLADGIKSITRSVIDVGKTCVMAASDAMEMQQKFNDVFGSMKDEATAWSKDFVNQVGGSVLEVKKQISDNTGLLQGLGLSDDAAYEFAKSIQVLGTDLGAFNNVAKDEAVTRFMKGIRGEHENFDALGIAIRESTLQAELKAKGDKRSFTQLTELEKMQLRYEVALKQSQKAIGYAEKESGSFNSQLQTLKGNMQNLAVEIGSKLIPPLNEFITKVNDNFPQIVQSMKDGIGSLIETFNTWKPVILGCMGAYVAFKSVILAANTMQGIISLVEMYKRLRDMQLLSAAAQALLNTVMVLSPTTLIVAGIAAVVAMFVNWEKVIHNVINGAKELWNNVAGFFGLDSLKFDIETTHKTNNEGWINNPIPKYATGTKYHKGGIALVGEHGPELIKFPSGSEVTPADKTRQLFDRTIPKVDIKPYSLENPVENNTYQYETINDTETTTHIDRSNTSTVSHVDKSNISNTSHMDKSNTLNHRQVDRSNQILNTSNKKHDSTFNITINGSNMDAEEVASILVPKIKQALQNT